ncbi:flagellin [Campylobacter sp. RM16188]|uniref:flagellin n=1 Tax=Campylobacter sp. RM16188 TaxID=1705725 RepID=UPI00155537BF|nr:flagellin [Campylobacter sp. RM16188]
MKLGNNFASTQNQYLDQAKNATQKALNNIAANRAISGEDSSNLIIADNLRSQSSALEQGISNANDAIAILQIADSTLENITKSADRINELSVKMNSPILNQDQRNMLTREANALTQSMQDSIAQASFNGKNIFSENLSFFTGDKTASVNLSSVNLKNLDINDQQSVVDFISSINSLRSEIGSTQNGIFSSINTGLAKNTALRASEANLLNDDLAKNIGSLNSNTIKLNASIFAQIHNTSNLQNQVARLLG